MSEATGILGKWDKPVWAILFAVVICFALWARVENPPPKMRSPDEVHYAYYTANILISPLEAPANIVAAYNAEPSSWTYPIPLRVSYLYTMAAIAAGFHVSPIQAGVALSTGASILQLAIVALVCLRFFNRWTALAAVAMLSVSPQDLAIASRVWGDGACGCLALIMLWLGAEIATREKAGPWYAAFWGCSVYFLLLKESGGFYFGFCVLGLMLLAWQRQRAWRPVLRIAGVAVITAFAAFAIMAGLCGGASAALETAHHSAQAAPTNTYGLAYQSGPFYSLPLGLWVLSPIAALCCAMAFAALLQRGNALKLDARQRPLIYGTAALIVLVIASVTAAPALKNLRYISFITGHWYIMAALGLTWLADRLRARYTVIAIACVLAFSCYKDYARYHRMFVYYNMRDLNIRQVVGVQFGEVRKQ